MKTLRLLALTLAAMLFSSAPGFAATIRGVWEFSDPAALGAGQTLPGGVASPTLTVEGAVPIHVPSLSDGVTTLNGIIATVAGPANRLRLTHGIAPNGGSGTLVRQYSLLFDVFSPEGSRDSWRSFFQTAAGNNNDGDYFIKPENNKLGTAELGYTTDELDDGHWKRVVIVVDLPSVKVYVNGALFHTHANQALDGRYALESQLLLFADNDGENAALNVGAVAMWSGALTGSEVAALSGPGTANIGVNQPPPEIVVERAGMDLGRDGVVAWGYNGYGQTTVPAGAQSGVVAIAAGDKHTVALKGNGSVVAWGDNGYGQTTVPAGAQSGVTAIAGGGDHSVVLKSNGSVVAWGWNANGQTTVAAGAQSGVTAIAAGYAHTVALKSNGSVVAWGLNDQGQATVPAGAQSGVAAIAADGYHTVALKSDGSVLAWGYNNSGQTTVPAGAQSGVVAIAAGLYHTVALKSDGSVLAWGSNTSGQTTVPAGAQTGVTAIAAGGSHTLALKNDGSVVAWGYNANGQTTVPAGAQSGVTAIAAGLTHTVALVAKTPTVAFPSQGLGSSSAAMSFVVKNTGTVPLALSGVSVTGGQAGDFTVNTTGMPASLPAGWQTTFSVTFTPSAFGTRATTLRIVNDDPDENLFDIALTGTGTDATAPETTITSANPTPTTLTTRTITFTGTDNIAVTSFEGRLDGGAFATVMSPLSLSNLADGSHTYEVRARDAAGNVDATPASVTWVVERPEIAVEQPAGTELGAGGVVVWGYNNDGQTAVPAGAQSGVTAIAAGGYHTLALKSNGTVVAWGFNGNDQATVPAGAQSGVVAIAGGGDHSVVLKNNGSVFAWGFNSHGQTNVPPAALSGITAIAAGGYHTLALRSDGTVLAWGRNDLGQTTVPAGAQSGVIAIAAGLYHTVALRSDGSVVAWGRNDYGQTTVPAGAQSGVIAIAAGAYHTVALKSDGSMIAWGQNDYGQTTVPAGAQSGVTAIAAGHSYTLALKNDGSVLAWGDNSAGQTTVPAGAQTSVTAIAAGLFHTVALVTPTPTVAFASQVLSTTSAAKTFVVKNTGSAPLALSGVSVMGGQAGDFTVNTTGMLASVPAGGQTTFSVTFTPSALGDRATTLRIVNNDANENPFDIALTGAGADTTAPETTITSANPTPTNSTTRTITFTGTDNVAVTSFEGRLDGAAFETVTSPVSLSGLAGGSHTYEVRARDAAGNVDATPASVTWVVETPEIAVEQPAGTDLKRDGSVVAFGDNEDGQTTVPAGAQSGVTAIAAGFGHTVALKADGSVLAWGGNSNGQTTVPVAAQSGVTAIAAGDSHTVALKGDGSVVAWGNNNYGQTTVPAGAQSGVTAIAASFYQTVALKSDGTVLAWGYNADGQTTVPVAAQSGVVAIAAGQLHTVALKNDGSVVAWGYNADGQTTVPTAAQTGVTAIAAGYDHTVALKSNGTVLAWGSDGLGQTTVPTGAQSGVTAIAAGDSHTVARKSDGTVLAWGNNFDGQTTVPAGAQSGVTAIAAGAYYTVVIVAGAPTVAFASQSLGTTSAAKSFVVKNTGNAALALSGMSVTGGQAGDFTVDTTGMLASVPAGGQTTFSVTFTPSALGTRATMLRIVNNDADENPFDIALTGTRQSVFQAWATANGVANDLQAPGANGLKNLLNFAFAIHPVTGGPGPLRYAGTLAGGGTITATGQPMTVMEPGDMRALFVRRKDRVAAGLTYTPQFSPTLATWQESAALPTVLADDGVNQIVSVPYPALGPGEKSSFFRVVVSLAP